MRDTSQKGLISHTAVLNRLVQLGFEVLLPWADYLGYDLAYYVTEEHQNFGFFVHRESYLVRIQVKTAWLSKDGTAIEFNTSTVSAGKRGNKKSGYGGKAEYFGVCSPDTGKVYMVAVAEAAKSNMTLRLEGNAYVYPGTPVKWAKDHEI
ncbi:MAG: group I intron-associated PD-(D/E)XK endonuclease [Ktedonobacteraceae bacterium]